MNYNFWKKLYQFLCSTPSCYFNGKTLHFLKEVFFQWIIANPNSNRKIQPTLNAPPIFFVVCKKCVKNLFSPTNYFQGNSNLIHEYAANQKVHVFSEYIWNVSKRPWNVLAPHAICGHDSLFFIHLTFIGFRSDIVLDLCKHYKYWCV